MQPTGSRGRPQSTFVHAELTRELIERQVFGVPHVRRHCRLGSQEHVRRNRPQPAVPHPKRVHGHVDERSKLLLREIGGTTQFAQRGHDVNTMPFARGVVKRPPAYLAGDQEPFRRDRARDRNGHIAKHSAK